eukprot:15438091-Alexandrium_andersonii.AAC.1
MPGAILRVPKLLEHEAPEVRSCPSTTLQCCELFLLKFRTPTRMYLSVLSPNRAGRICRITDRRIAGCR